MIINEKSEFQESFDHFTLPCVHELPSNFFFQLPGKQHLRILPLMAPTTLFQLNSKTQQLCELFRLKGASNTGLMLL